MARQKLLITMLRLTLGVFQQINHLGQMLGLNTTTLHPSTQLYGVAPFKVVYGQEPLHVIRFEWSSTTNHEIEAERCYPGGAQVPFTSSPTQNEGAS